MSRHSKRGGVKWTDASVSILMSKLGGSKIPGFAKIADDGAGSQGVFASFFSASTEEEVYADVQMPHGWQTGRDLPQHVHWAPTTANAGNVTFGIEYIVWPIGGVLDPNGTTILTFTIASPGIALKHTLSESLADIDMSSVTGVSSTILYRIFRDATNVLDTYPDDIVLIYADPHIPLLDRGSVNEFSQDV